MRLSGALHLRADSTFIYKEGMGSFTGMCDSQQEMYGHNLITGRLVADYDRGHSWCIDSASPLSYHTTGIMIQYVIGNHIILTLTERGMDTEHLTSQRFV